MFVWLIQPFLTIPSFLNRTVVFWTILSYLENFSHAPGHWRQTHPRKRLQHSRLGLGPLANPYANHFRRPRKRCFQRNHRLATRRGDHGRRCFGVLVEKLELDCIWSAGPRGNQWFWVQRLFDFGYSLQGVLLKCQIYSGAQCGKTLKTLPLFK